MNCPCSITLDSISKPHLEMRGNFMAGDPTCSFVLWGAIYQRSPSAPAALRTHAMCLLEHATRWGFSHDRHTHLMEEWGLI